MAFVVVLWTRAAARRIRHSRGLLGARGSTPAISAASGSAPSSSARIRRCRLGGGWPLRDVMVRCRPRRDGVDRGVGRYRARAHSRWPTPLALGGRVRRADPASASTNSATRKYGARIGSSCDGMGRPWAVERSSRPRSARRSTPGCDGCRAGSPTHRGRVAPCRRCFGSPILSAAGLGSDVPHGVQHGLSTRIKTIVDHAVADYTAQSADAPGGARSAGRAQSCAQLSARRRT